MASAVYAKVINIKGNPMYYFGEGKEKRLIKRALIPKETLLSWGETVEEDGVEITNEPDDETNPMDTVSETVDEEDENDPNLRSIPQSEPVLQLPKECIFCGFEATRQKFLNMIKVPLCEEHWSTKTTGEIAQEMREKQIG